MKLQETRQGQYMITIPRAIIIVLRWEKEDKINFYLDTKNRIILKNDKLTPFKSLQLVAKLKKHERLHDEI